MGWFTGHKVNEGVRIEGNGASVDIIVRAIMGSRIQREADLEIRGIPYLQALHIKHSDLLVKLEDGIGLRVYNGIRHASNQITLCYILSDIYKIEKIIYFLF